MSQEYKVVSILDTRLEATSGQAVTFALEKGAKYINYNSKGSNYFSNQGGNWILDPTGDLTCRDPRIVLEVPQITITLNVTNTTGGALKVITADNFGLKKYPLARSMVAVNHQINAASYPFNPYQILDALAHLNDTSQDANYYPVTQPDLIDSYANATGSAINPLGPYSNSAAGEGVFKPRTPQFTVTNNTVAGGATQTVTITIVGHIEPLITYYTNIGSKDRRALYGINNETVQVQFCNNLLQSMVAFVAPAGITVNSSTVDLGNTANLRTIILTPPDDIVASLPRNSVYQHPIYEPQSYSYGSLAPAAVLPFNQTINFNNIPTKILVFAKLASQDYATSAPDKYLHIKSAIVTFDSQQPCLSTATPRQLWEVSTRNGLCLPWQCWDQQVLNSSLVAGGAPALYGCGSVLCLSPAYDLSIRTGAASGSAGRYVCNFQMQFENLTATAFPSVQIWVVGVTEGILERDGSMYRDYQQTFPTDILAQAGLAGYVTQQQFRMENADNAFLSGGGLKDLLAKAASWAVSHPKELIDAAQTGSKLISEGRKLLGKGTLQSQMENAPRQKLFYQ